MIARVATAALIGYDGCLVEVETDLKQGLPGIQIVGMGNKAVSEARERVRSAIRHSQLDFPSRKITISLAPAELPKDGAHFDLPIAISILVASKLIHPWEIAGMLFAGELSLDGKVRPIRGAISITELARQQGYDTVFLPKASEPSARLVPGIQIVGVGSLKELFQHLKGVRRIHQATTRLSPPPQITSEYALDDVVGQEQAKRALAIAAAGWHNLLLIGPPGTGKTMLAKLLPALLPPPTPEEKLEITKLHSLAGDPTEGVYHGRPFRSPHHTASVNALIGGGPRPRPGEISLAHNGVLFLDELLEFPRSTLETLRQPLEEHKITLIRPYGRLTYPARFMLVATTNPCPCGYLGDETRECRCRPSEISRYQGRLSGPLLDRFDLVVRVPRADANTYLARKSLSNSQHSTVLDSIKYAYGIQKSRDRSSTDYNELLAAEASHEHLQLPPGGARLLEAASLRFGLSARGYFKVVKVARTIADLESSERISANHIAEALQYRAENSP